jgi:hypothetical protein
MGCALIGCALIGYALIGKKYRSVTKPRKTGLRTNQCLTIFPIELIDK